MGALGTSRRVWALSLKGLWLVESLGGDFSSEGMAVAVHGVGVVVVGVQVGGWRVEDGCWVGCSGWRGAHAQCSFMRWGGR